MDYRVEAQICQLLYRLALALDEGDLDTFAGCFCHDATFTTEALEPVVGRETIRSYFAQRRDLRRARGEQPRHVVTNVMVVGEDAGEVSSIAYVTGFGAVAEGPPVITTGWYYDKWRHAGKGWQISHHRIHADSGGDDDSAAPLAGLLNQFRKGSPR